uniref:BTB domain-containing protein n=1 Tax=Arcella intermedia TaxID=1963864 RepID=A0A6B2L4L9_9EUKA
MYIFGGKSSSYMNDFYRFDLVNHSWSAVEVVSGRAPSKRYGHIAEVWGNSMWVYGGYDDFGYKSDELYQFRFDTKIWHKINYVVAQPQSGPVIHLEKYQHTGNVYNDGLYVFGGRCDKKEFFGNDLLKYCFATGTWAKVVVKGRVPSPRWGHKTVVYNGKMYLTGGCDYVVNFNDMFKFKFETSTWSKVDVGDFDPRFFHSACIHQDRMLIFAGRNIHDYLFDSLYSYNLEEPRAIESYTDHIYEDMKKLLTNEQNTDLVFKFVNEGNICLYAHKGILMIRCEAFRIMFSSGMKETSSKEVIIEKDSYKSFLYLLLFLYTGKVELDGFTMEELIELLQLSDRFFLHPLKRACEKAFKKFITHQTLSQLYEVGENSKAHYLTNLCAKWTANRLETIELSTLSPGLRQETQEIRKLK